MLITPRTSKLVGNAAFRNRWSPSSSSTSHTKMGEVRLSLLNKKSENFYRIENGRRFFVTFETIEFNNSITSIFSSLSAVTLIYMRKPFLSILNIDSD